MKKLLFTFAFFSFGLMSFSQFNPNYERIGFDEGNENTSALVTTYLPNGDSLIIQGDSIIYPQQISNFPPIEAETDSTGYIFFDFNKSYPYMKYINGKRILLMTADQSRQIASDLSEYSIMDSIAINYEFQTAYYKDLIIQKDSTIFDLNETIDAKDSEIATHNLILKNKDKEIQELEDKNNLYLKDIGTKNKTINKQKWMIGGAVGIAIGIPVLMLIFGK